MKSNDVVQLFGHSLLIEFCSTGQSCAITTIPLDQGATFTIEGNALMVRTRANEAPALVDRFASEALAASAFGHLRQAVRHYVRMRRTAVALKRVLLWGVLPLVSLMLALSLNVALTRLFNVAGISALPLAALPPTATTATTPTVPARPSSTELANAIGAGVQAGKFSVRLSAGKNGALYVFSDPACSHCEKLETELDTLAKDFTIHLFPVSVVGGNLSAARISGVLCATPEARAAAWKAVMGGKGTAPSACPEGTAALEANDQIFHAMQFTGTPTLVNADGAIAPEAMPNTAAAIERWLMQARRDN